MNDQQQDLKNRRGMLSVIVPVYNEQDNLYELKDHLKNL
jgi:cellulose synthase/poly-beta-1,6-N-acetylglucosamine synthase-like glycosyltransferase